MSEQFYFGIIQDCTKENIEELLIDLENILEVEPNLIRIPKGKTMIIGDLHGDFETVMKIIERFFIENMYILSLGIKLPCEP